MSEFELSARYGEHDVTSLESFSFRANSTRILVFSIAKHVFDKVAAVMCLPLIAVIAVALLALNPFLNPGPLLFWQTRMGKNGKAFRMCKFRSMVPADVEARSHDDGLETHRITPLGRALRKFRIDELPNMFNVLKSEMSVVGPRPDALDHAEVFGEIVPGYKGRLRVRPGITGSAQVEMGYAVGAQATAEKVRWDIRYIVNYGFRQELRIVLKTLKVIATGFGAR